MSITVPYLGCGIGLRTKHFNAFMETSPACAWVEAVSENFMRDDGRPMVVIDHVRGQRPVVLHGVSLGIGSSDPISTAYLTKLQELMQRVEPAWISDHLCWNSFQGLHSHDLLPLPYTEEVLQHVVERVDYVQSTLRQQILLENVSSYVQFKASTMAEWEFLAEVARRADCGILLDINNVYVSARNHGFAPIDYLAALPADRIGQIHLAGHADLGTHVVDNHGGPVCDAVWELYRAAIRRLGPVSTLIEWDNDIPDLSRVLAEAERAAAIVNASHAPREAA